MTAADVIQQLGLEPLPREGGFFRRTWVSRESSAILFLLTPESFSAWHRIPQTELWHFHAGDAVEHLILRPGATTVERVRLGSAVLAGESVQRVVPGGVWQAARLAPAAGLLRQGFALLGCTLAPPWDEARFELGSRAELEREFPAARNWVRSLTR